MAPRSFVAIVATLAGLTTGAPDVGADGGVVRVSQPAGPFAVTVFTSPTPFRAGPVDISVMVRDRADDQPVLDAEVSIRLTSLEGAPTTRAAATRANATNKLLYAALFDLPRDGRWRLAVAVRRDGGVGEVTTEVTAEPRLPPLASFWPYLLLPLVVVALFCLHQWLTAPAAGRTRRSAGC